MISQEQMARILARFEELEALMADQSGGNDFAALGKEYSELTPVVKAIRDLDVLKQQIADAEEILADADSDADMRELAEMELEEGKSALPDAEHQTALMMLPKDEADSKNAIMEFRAGTGGDEAALFAGDLFRMYERYAGQHGWKWEVMDASESEVGGFKEVSVAISGSDVFARLKFESGVHRVQRVPETESGGRIHTSAATVAVLPEAEDVDIHIEASDLRIDTFRAQGAGGQHVNTTDSAVRITHVPTGIVAQCQDEKSQHKNKEKAMKMLRSRIYDEERQRIANERAADRKGQVGSGDRSERIRTYNFPQGRCTDHRINLTLYKLDQIMQGEGLDEVIDALITEDQAERLASFGNDSAI